MCVKKVVRLGGWEEGSRSQNPPGLQCIEWIEKRRMETIL